jgi:hypothetical protein
MNNIDHMDKTTDMKQSDTKVLVPKNSVKDKPKQTNCALKKKKIKCSQCKMKCDMLHFTCRCEKIFCIKHQLPHNHNCQFNNKQKCKVELNTKNPKVKHSTLVKI